MPIMWVIDGKMRFKRKFLDFGTTSVDSERHVIYFFNVALSLSIFGRAYLKFRNHVISHELSQSF